MDWHIVIGILAGIIQVYAVIPYIKDIIWGTTNPNIVSWSLWTMIQLIGVMVMVTSPNGMSWSLVLLLATTFNTGLVTIIGLHKYWRNKNKPLAAGEEPYVVFGTVEKVCLVLALIAIGFFATTRDPILTLTFDILADIAASIPTVIKTWKDPHSEIAGPWFLVAFAAALGVLSSNIMNAENLALPIYLTLLNGTIAVLAYVGQKRRPKVATT